MSSNRNNQANNYEAEEDDNLSDVPEDAPPVEVEVEDDDDGEGMHQHAFEENESGEDDANGERNIVTEIEIENDENGEIVVVSQKTSAQMDMQMDEEDDVEQETGEFQDDSVAIFRDHTGNSSEQIKIQFRFFGF